MFSCEPLSTQPIVLPPVPSWVPLIGGVPATLYADFTQNEYWYSSGNQIFGTAAGWIAALGGTFTRASAGSYTNSSGLLVPNGASNNVLRFDYSVASIGAPQGILLEGASTNLSTQSQTLSSWTIAGGTSVSLTTNAAVAPDGTVTANLITASAGTQAHQIYKQNGSLTTLQTNSVFAKAGTASYLGLTGPTGSQAITEGAFFNLSTGTIGTVSGTGTATMQSLPNGWYRCAYTNTETSGTYYNACQVNTADNQVSNWNAAGTESIYIWGPQTEALSFASSYIPTTASTATRAADSFTLPFAANGSDSLLVKAVLSGVQTTNTAYLTGNANGSQINIPNNSTVQTFNGSTALTTSSTTGSLNKIVAGGTPSSRAIANNGAAAATDTTNAFWGGTLPTQLFLGNNGTGNSAFGDYYVVGAWIGLAVSGAQASTLSTLP